MDKNNPINLLSPWFDKEIWAEIAASTEAKEAVKSTGEVILQVFMFWIARRIMLKRGAPPWAATAVAWLNTNLVSIGWTLGRMERAKRGRGQPLDLNEELSRLVGGLH